MDEFSARVKTGLETLDWFGRRNLFRTLVKRVDIDQIQINVVFRVEAPLPGSGGSGFLQHCRGRVSPLLSNLFLHYVFDKWLQQHYLHIVWCRYADDGLLHCQSEAQARFILKAVRERFEQCGLELHPAKTKIAYCKDERRTGDYPNTPFDFPGYSFRRRSCWAVSLNRMILGFTPAVSRDALKSMRTVIRTSRLRRRTDLSLKEIADWLNPVMSGWLAYYGKYYRSAMYVIVRHVNKALVRWAMRKYKALRRGKTRASAFLERCMKESPRLFVHWREGMKGAFA